MSKITFPNCSSCCNTSIPSLCNKLRFTSRLSGGGTEHYLMGEYPCDQGVILILTNTNDCMSIQGAPVSCTHFAKVTLMVQFILNDS